MKSILKRTLLTTAFGSVALLAGCSHETKKPPRHYFTQPEVTAAMTKAAEAQGATILKTNNCQLIAPDTDDRSNWSSGDDSCSIDIVKKHDDGLVFRAKFYAPSNTLAVEGCYYRPGDPVAAQAANEANKIYEADVALKFGKLGFTVLDTFSGVASNQYTEDGACVQYMSADYLLKADGKLYSAKFRETWSFAGKTASEPAVSDLQPVDRPPPGKRVASTATEETTRPAPEARQREEKPEESKICVGNCVGPHIDLQTGKVKVLGNGPGYKF